MRNFILVCRYIGTPVTKGPFNSLKMLLECSMFLSDAIQRLLGVRFTIFQILKLCERSFKPWMLKYTICSKVSFYITSYAVL